MDLDLVGEDGNVHCRHHSVLGKLLDMIRVSSPLEDQSFRPKNNTNVQDAAPQPAQQQTFEPLLGGRKVGGIVDWSKQHGLKSLAVGSFKENDGPPTYRVAREADVTVVLFVNRKVQATFGFREKELTDEALRRVLEALPRLVEKKPK